LRDAGRGDTTCWQHALAHRKARGGWVADA